ncbi:MAG: hypothetical protein AUF76_04095 [Acidobacteria bacterium 13_1_20CM_2_65_9]|nr:MAG: hypothetical protein AUF76_04095 [Acidobacteria bacterium 13_1_20CM_2_65_9]
MIDGSRPNARVHKPCVRTTTLAFSRSSSAERARPTSGDTPRTVNSSGETRAASSRSGDATPDNSYVALRNAAVPEYDRAASRMISKSGAEKSNLSTGAPGMRSKITTSCRGSL